MEKTVSHCCLNSHFIAAVVALGQCFRLSRSVVTESGERVIWERMTCVSHSRKGRGEDQGTSSFCFQDGTVFAHPRRIAWPKHIPQRPISQPFTSLRITLLDDQFAGHIHSTANMLCWLPLGNPFLLPLLLVYMFALYPQLVACANLTDWRTFLIMWVKSHCCS